VPTPSPPGAQANRIELDLQVGVDRLIELFLLQNYTPALPPGHFSRMPSPVAESRLKFIEQLCDWARAEMNSQPADRLSIFVAPELSLPVACIDLLKEFAAQATRPLIFVGGLEFFEQEEYTRLIQSEVTDFDNKEQLLRGLKEHQFVNAAVIVLRDRDGGVHTYLQPKRNLSAPEVSQVFGCPEFLLFTSRNQTAGPRLNFVVQICSDFTSTRCVSDLRRACSEVAPEALLDFTFVLQSNEDQEKTHWKQSAAAYFSPPENAAITGDGVLVFVNNSSRECGKSTTWGRSSVLFHFLKKWKVGAPPTYWMDEQGAFDHQAAIVREPGPSLYWLRYKPHYLVSRRSGDGQPEPFLASDAAVASIRHDSFDSSFGPIQPVAHWLESEWKEGRRDFELLLPDMEVEGDADELREECLGAYDAFCVRWSDAFGPTDVPARQTADTYFEGIQEEWFPAKTIEPQLWCKQAQQAARRFHALLTIMNLAGKKEPLFALRPAPAPVSHAVTDSKVPVTLIWGNRNRRARDMMADFLRARRSRAVTDELAPQALLVLVESIDPPSDPGEATSLLRKQFVDDITRKSARGDVPGHLRSAGAAVDAHADPRLSCICDSHIFTALTNAAAQGELPSEAVRDVIEWALQ
jgi:hypothetical protein